jgi:hypothetical protein
MVAMIAKAAITLLVLDKVLPPSVW